VRFRAARTWTEPEGTLVVELRDPGQPKEKGKPLARAVFCPGDAIPDDDPDTEVARLGKVARFYKWLTAELKVAGLEKGKTYELAITSPESRISAPWLVNCFYRDACPDGECLRRRGDAESRAGRFDLAFELRVGEETVLTSVPKDAELPSGSEHFGLGHDGTDLRGRPGQPGGGPAEAPFL
jgi:hypothetical protein